MSFDLKCGGRIAKHVAFWTFWTYVAGQNGDISPHRVRSVGYLRPRHRAVYVCPTLVHLEHVGRTVVFLSIMRAKKVTFLGTAPGLRLSYVSRS